MKPFFKMCVGRTRLVILVGKLAFKFPNVTSWFWFLRGLLDNMHEYQHRNDHTDALAPIFFFIPGGFLNVMARVETFTEEDCPPIKDYFKSLYKAHKNGSESAYAVLEITEAAECGNFGYYKDRVVSIDYGHGRNAYTNIYIVEEWIRAEEYEQNHCI